jgi:hypothetical protein
LVVDCLGEEKIFVNNVNIENFILNVMSSSWISGEYKKDELLEAARSGNEEQMMALLTPLNVNCHASDGRKVLLSFVDFFFIYVFYFFFLALFDRRVQ